MKKPYYITTAIAYASGIPHIGNDYEIVLADAIARYRRLEGYDVFFQTGSDEHGLKVEQKAKANNLSPKEFVDNIVAQIQENYAALNISYDYFQRTTNKQHEETVSKVFEKLYQQGDIYKAEYEGWYCVNCESFYGQSQIDEAGRCPDGHSNVTKEKEETYFFKLANYQEQLVNYLESHPEFIMPALRKNEMLNNFILPGLKDLAVSRRNLAWGVKTFDEQHSVYVWLDALLNYITSLGYDPNGNHSEAFKKYWPANLQLIGKDIMRFHSIYWTSFLFALGLEPPKQIFGHPWLLMGKQKMSKSMGKVIYSKDMIEIFTTDGLRFLMLHEMPYDRDGTLTLELMIERFNSELVNTLGNLVKRTLAMNQKYFQGKIKNTKVSDSMDDSLIEQATNLSKQVQAAMETLHVQDALTLIFDFFRRCNKYIDETTPWILAKDEKTHPRLQTVLYNLLESLRIGAINLKAFIPTSAETILTYLNTQQTSFASAFHFHQLEDDIISVFDTPSLFERLDATQVLSAFENDDKVALTHKKEITMDDFSKIELRKGLVLDCQKHKNADSLLVFQVDLGDKQVQIVSGIANSYQPKQLIGKEVLVCVNLKPIKLRGEKSQGMILSALKEDGTFQVVEIPQVANGTEIA